MHVKQDVGGTGGLRPAAPLPSTSQATDLGIGPMCVCVFPQLIEPAASHGVKRNNAAALPKSNTLRKSKQT